MYKVMGKYQGKWEEIDTAEDINEADYLVSKYRMAYGPEWTIKHRKTGRKTKKLPDE